MPCKTSISSGWKSRLATGRSVGSHWGNGGATGIDGQGFEDIETYGRAHWLDELTEALRTGSYRAEAIRRVEIPKLNRLLVGWADYFCLGPVSHAYESVDRHMRHRLRQWLCRKHKVRGGVRNVTLP